MDPRPEQEAARFDRALVAHRNGRIVVHIRRWMLILAVTLPVLSFVCWRVGRHLSAALWLEVNHYAVSWGIDRTNWTKGGATTIRYSRPHLLNDDRPNLEMGYLTHFLNLEELDLSSQGTLDDTNIDNIDKVTGLRNLYLGRDHQPDWVKSRSKGLTDASLVRIGSLRQLEELNLGSQGITDAGLANLAGLERLQSLDLVGTKITDAGLEHLKALPALKTLDLSRTRVTADGITRFEAARPSVTVIADPPPPIPAPKTPR